MLAMCALQYYWTYYIFKTAYNMAFKKKIEDPICGINKDND